MQDGDVLEYIPTGEEVTIVKTNHYDEPNKTYNIKLPWAVLRYFLNGVFCETTSDLGVTTKEIVRDK